MSCSNYSPELLSQIEASTIAVSVVEDIDINALNSILESNNFAIIKGLIASDAISSSVDKLKQLHNPDNDNPATGEHPHQLMDNYQKLSIGGAEHSGTYRPRCMRTFYNPIWADDIYGLREAFRTTAKIRNILYGFNVDYAIDDVESNFWTASRIHHYPAGGGFLVSHVDNIVPSVQSKSQLSNEYYQPVIVMSKKGTSADSDFETGGGFFVVNKERFFYEEVLELGDIIIYSGKTVHGVADIDLNKSFDSRSSEGRFAGFVTLYRKFLRERELEDYVEMPKKPIAR